MGNHSNAIKDFNEVIKIAPKQPVGYLRRGFSHIAISKFKEAELDFEIAHDMESLQMDDEIGIKPNAGIQDG